MIGFATMALQISTNLGKFPSMYQNMKDKYNPEIRVTPSLSFEKISLSLAYSIMTFLYLYSETTSNFLMISYATMSLIFFMYLNMYLFMMSQKRIMLLSTLGISLVSYVLYESDSRCLNMFLFFLLNILLCLVATRKAKHMLSGIKEEEFSTVSLVNSNIIVFMWLVYALTVQLYYFCFCSFAFGVCYLQMVVGVLYISGKVNENNKMIVFLKRLYRIQTEVEIAEEASISNKVLLL